MYLKIKNVHIFFSHVIPWVSHGFHIGKYHGFHMGIYKVLVFHMGIYMCFTCDLMCLTCGHMGLTWD